jgi:carboxylesterase
MPCHLPKSSPKAFRYEGRRGSVLLLHGFTGTPYELKPLSNALHKAGFTCFAPLLDGHGETPEHLNQISADTWMESAEKALASLPLAKPRIVIGFSMGGLLATLLSVSHSEQVDKLVLIAPAFHLRFYGELAVWLSKMQFSHDWFVPKGKKGGDILDESARKKNPSYEKTPIKALAQLNRLRQKATQSISQISCPTLALFGLHDRTVHSLKTANLLQKKITSPYFQWFFKRSAHVLPLDFDRDELIERILIFCESHASSKISKKQI